MWKRGRSPDSTIGTNGACSGDSLDFGDAASVRGCGDQGELDGYTRQEFKKHIMDMLPSINQELPNYAQIKKMELMPEDFERTPKKSIKRYLYQRN